MRRIHIAILSSTMLLFVCAEAAVVYLSIDFYWQLIALGLICWGIGALGSRVGLKFYAVLISLLPAWILYILAYLLGWLGVDGQLFVIYPLVVSAAAVLGAVVLGSVQVKRVERISGYVLGLTLVIAISLISAGLGNGQSAYRGRAFTLGLSHGRRITSGQLVGRPVVIAFWANWCMPCRRELPDLETLYKRYKARASFFLVDVDDGGKIPSKAVRFLHQKGIGLPSVLSGADRLESLFDPDKVVPVVIVLGGKGQTIFKHYGFTGKAADLKGLANELHDISSGNIRVPH